jgi:type II secretory pathway component PulF
MSILHTLQRATDLGWLRQQLQLLPFRAQRAEFYRDLSEMYKRNESMMGFLEGEIDNAKRLGQSSKATALRIILRRYQRGDQAGRISYLLDSVMPSSDAMMLVGLDHAQDKSAALKSLSEAVGKQTHMKRMVLGYAVLPAIMAPLAYVLIVLLSKVILAVELAASDEISEQLWSGLNGIARWVAHLVIDHGMWMMAALTLVLFGVVYSLPRWRGRMRLQCEKLPVYNLYRDFQCGLLFTTMAMLLQNGGTLKGALEDIAQRSSRWMRWHILRVLAALDENPTAMLRAFGRGLLSKHLQARAATLMRTAPSFSDVLIELGTTQEGRVLERVKVAALSTNIAVVGALLIVACLMGVACVTVPGQFANLTQPSAMIDMRQQRQLRLQQQQQTLQQQTTSPLPLGAEALGEKER